MVCTIPSSAEAASSVSLTIRNIGLQIVRSLTETYPDLVSTFLGFDWLLSFLHPALQLQSIVLVLDVLCDLLLKNANNLLFFREARHFGCWLRDSTQHRRRNDVARLIPSHQSSLQVNLEVVTVSGFRHAAPTARTTPPVRHLDVHLEPLSGKETGRLWRRRSATQPRHGMYPYIVVLGCILFLIMTQQLYHIADLVGAVCHLTGDAHQVSRIPHCLSGSSVRCAEYGTAMCGAGWTENANCVLQVIIYMYHNWPQFGQFALNGEFVQALASCLFTSNDEDPQVIVKLSNTRRLVLDLLRMVITDSLALAADKAALIADTWLDAYPEAMKSGQVTLYQTELAEFIMDHVMAINVVVDTSGTYRPTCLS